MTIVSKSSAFPKTVQPGLPKLGDRPKGWIRAPLSKFLHEERRPVEMNEDEEYRLVTVKRARGGVIEREQLCGRDIAVKSQFRVCAGDFLISKRQIVHGACGLVPQELDGAIVSNEYAVLRGNADIDLDFLRCLTHSIYFQETCFHSSIGVHIEKMLFNLPRWLSWPFDVPPIHEQREIVAVLSAWDQAIETAERLIANSQVQKNALVQQLLAPLLLPTHGSRAAHPTSRIGDVAECFSGGTPSRIRPEFFGGAIPWIKSGEVNSRYIDETEETITDAGLDNSAAKLVNPGTILLAMYGATAGKLAISRITAAINQAVLAINPSKTVVRDFLFFVLEQKMTQVSRLVQGGQPNLNAQIIKNTKIVLPDHKEQTRISHVLQTADSQLSVQSANLGALKSERRALYQQLLGGKRRVRLTEKAA